MILLTSLINNILILQLKKWMVIVQHFCNLLVRKRANITCSVDSNKASNPNSISCTILLLLKNEISKQFADSFNLSFVAGIFPSILKTAKVVPVLKKDSELDYSNYLPISLLLNIKKILEKLVY